MVLMISEIILQLPLTQGSPSASPSAAGVIVGVLITFLAGISVYFVRQLVERLKLRKALQVEIQQMSGIKQCAESMQRINFQPSSRNLQPDEVPPAGAIPTVVYESNAGRLGLLSASELNDIVAFYSKVLHYKAIIAAVRREEGVPNPDQKDLYNSIGDLQEQRNGITSDVSFRGIFNGEE